MKQLINDELNDLLLDIRESLGNVLDHPGDLESKEDEIKAVFADIQKAIDMTESVKMTEKEQQSYKILKNVWEAIEKRDVVEAFYYWQMEDETKIDKKSQIKVMKKFLNEVAE